MKRILKIALGSMLVVVLGLIGTTAVAAHGLHGRGEFMKHRATAFIDGALDAAKATPEQRSRIVAARDQVFATFEARHEGRGLDINEAVAIFDADKIDAAKVSALRAKHEGQAKQTGDAIEVALLTAHDTLSPAQRKLVADYVRSHKPEHAGHAAGGEWRGNMMKKFVTGRIDAAVAAINVTAEQKAVVDAARDHVFASIEEAHGSDGALMEQGMQRALALFEADKIDPAQVSALRAEHQAKAQKVGDAVVQAVYDVHDALTATQRKALTDYVRAQHGRWHHGAPDGTAAPTAPSQG